MKYFIEKICQGSVLCVILLGLGACGPRTVGDDVEIAQASGHVSAAHDPANLRYPHNGSNVEKSLYYINTPAYMNAQQRNIESFLQQGLSKEEWPNDYTNLQPRQVSPFRQ